MSNYYFGDDIVTYETPRCFHCGEVSYVDVRQCDLWNWKVQRQYVQDAFPEMKPEIRELLISGTHPRCWDEIYGNSGSDIHLGDG